MSKTFKILRESISKVLSEGKAPTYNDEHAHANVWNHMVDKGIAHDKEAMLKELQKAKKDKKHPLHFDNASPEGFIGGEKTSAHQESYYNEIETAVHTIHALAQRPELRAAIKGQHRAVVQGGARGELSELWKKHGASTSGATSKADISIVNLRNPKAKGIKLSMKKGGGSQLMSAGPEETSAVHEHAVIDMLANHPSYKKLSADQKYEIHNKVMTAMKTVSKHLNGMKTATRDQMYKHRDAAQKAIDKIHDEHPELNNYVRKEATTGIGKFGADSPYSASFLVTSAAGKKEAKVQHADEIDYSGPRPRVSLPKGEGRTGNVKADQR